MEVRAEREERVAVFDNDGTLWPEKPVPFQFAFAVDRLQQELPGHPEWKTDPFVQAASGIVAKPTPALIQLQQDVIAALAPFTVDSGTSSAFVTTPDDLVINPALIEYGSAFVPKASGDHFSPHVTTGVASREFLDHMLEEPFESFEFGLIAAAVYQLGQFGTAAKKLKSLRLLARRAEEARAVGSERHRAG